MWSLERVELLKTLWAQGLSAAQIAARLGGVTRNAVIGKVHRLNLPGRAVDTRAARRAAPCWRKRNGTASKCKPPSPKLIWRDAPEPFGLKRVTIAELEPGRCHWPIGDPKTPAFRYCGEPAHGRSYCNHHAARA